MEKKVRCLKGSSLFDWFMDEKNQKKLGVQIRGEADVAVDGADDGAGLLPQGREDRGQGREGQDHPESQVHRTCVLLAIHA